MRIGNEAHEQLQLDVYGEVMDALYQARRGGLARSEAAAALQLAFLEHLEKVWREPDEGIWEVRGGRRHFTYSKVMAWVAFDRAVKSHEVSAAATRARDRWRTCATRSTPRSAREASMRRSAASCSPMAAELDASLLLMPLVGFLPADDPRILGTVAAIERGFWSTASCCATARDRAGRTAGRRGRVPGLQLLAGRRLCAAGALRGGARAVRTAAGACATMSAC